MKMEEWKEVRLGDYCDFQNGYAFKSSEFKTNGEYKIVKIKELKDGHVKFFDDSASVDVQDIKEFEKYKIYRNDVLFALTGDPVSKPNPLIWVGRVSIYRSDENALLNQRTCKIKKSEKFDNQFLYYYFRQWDNFYALASKATGSASQANISTNTIADTIIKLPPLHTQQKIAAILSSLDDKIELNNKINTNLEQQAGALFKNWFVDFEPFGGKMPEGWKVGKLGDFVEIKRGGSPRPIQKFLSDEGYRWLKISDVTSLSAPFVLNIAEHIKEEGLSKTVFLKAGSLVLSNSATPGIPKILDLDTCIHDGWLYFPKSQLSNEYLYLLFKEIRPQLVNLGNGSIFTNLKTDILKNFEISLPSTETLSKFQNIIKPIFEKMLATQREIKQLETLRDTLLPKLMNGEIKV